MGTCMHATRTLQRFGVLTEQQTTRGWAPTPAFHNTTLLLRLDTTVLLTALLGLSTGCGTLRLTVYHSQLPPLRSRVLASRAVAMHPLLQ